jgi:L-aminopeptidase/D-esterase-like protein
MEPWVPKNAKQPSTKTANVFETNEGTINWDAEDPPQVHEIYQATKYCATGC